MIDIPKGPSRSRINKKQLGAHLDSELVGEMKAFCRKESLSQTEILAMAINEAVSEYGSGPLLQVSRERLVYRLKSPSQAKKDGPKCRMGTKSVAAFYSVNDVERVKAFSNEKGVPISELADKGMRRILSKQPKLKNAA